MECFNKKCICQSMCDVAGCVLKHPLFSNTEQEIANIIEPMSERMKERTIIDLLQEKQPPKVRRSHIDRWWSLRRFKGIDLDKGKVHKFISPFYPQKQESTVNDKEHQSFLAHQTPEQFELAKKHGWRIAKFLTEPEPNFHSE